MSKMGTKNNLIETLTKQQLRKIAMGLGIEKTWKMNISKLVEQLEPFSYTQIVNSLNK